MSTLHILRVFADPAGRHGNPLGVFLDGPSVARGRRQQVAAELGWEDEERGHVRSRVFVPEHGIAEDEATGAAAVVMGARLGRPLEIRQGRGSRLTVRPGKYGRVEVGGRVLLDEIRDHRV